MRRTPPPASTKYPHLNVLGPRGLRGLFGWTFFDPGNLIALTLILCAATLVLVSMRGREAPDWPMAVGLYLCLFAFLRGYMFKYYHGRRLGRIVVLLVLVGGLAASALLWSDRAAPFEAFRGGKVVRVPDAPGLHFAALLHTVVAVTLVIHFLLPRRWLVRATDDIVDHVGKDYAFDAPADSSEAEEGPAGEL